MDDREKQRRGSLPLRHVARDDLQAIRDPPAGRSTRRGNLRVAGWAAAGLFVLQLGWMLVLPPAAGIDEFDHVYRASAVSMGHWKPGRVDAPPLAARGGMLPVRADLVEAAGPACARLPYTRLFNCHPYRDLRSGVVEVASGVDYYNPLYYAVIGTVSRPFTGTAAINAMRTASSIACAVMFGLAVFLTTGWARTRWPVALLLLTCLPTTVYSTALAAPNGPQMVSGLLVWAALICLVRGAPSMRRVAYPALMGAVAVMANTHTLGLLWLALIAVSLVAYQGLRRVAFLLVPRGRRDWLAFSTATAAVAFQLWWMAYARPNVSRPEGGLPGSPWGQIAHGLIFWPLEAIAAFPYRDEAAPGPVYGATLLLFIGLAVITVRALRRQPRLAMATGLALFLTAAVPIGITYVGFHQFGMAWQGRYGMTYSAGVLVLAGIALDVRGPTPRNLLLWLGLAGWGLAQTMGLTGVLAKQRADHVLVAATNWWVPPSWLVVAAGLLATAVWMRCLQLASAAAPVRTSWARGGATDSPDGTSDGIVQVR